MPTRKRKKATLSEIASVSMSSQATELGRAVSMNNALVAALGKSFADRPVMSQFEI